MAITLVYPAASFGDSNFSATPRPTPKIQISMTIYKTALSLFKVEVKSRERIREKINQVFRQAVNEAYRKEKIATKLAKNASAVSEIRLQRISAILLANSIRVASILAMGDAPELPDNQNEAPETQEDEPVKSEKRESEPTKKAKPKK